MTFGLHQVAALTGRCYTDALDPPANKLARTLMSVDSATVRRIARLARIAITDEEAARLQTELSGILDWVAQLDELDTGDVPPMTRVESMAMKKRPDEVTGGFIADDIVKNAPQVDDHYFVVPKIVE